MRLSILTLTIGLTLTLASGSHGQTPGQARVETAPLDLTAPDHYQVPVVLEPNRRVVMVAPADGIVRILSVPVGSSVREGAEVAQLDRAEASAYLRIAQAGVKEMQAVLDAAQAASPKSKTTVAQAEARLEAAKAHADLAQLAFDRCTLRAPFAGRVLAAKVSPGQYLPKGGELAELADVSALRALIPVDRTAVSVGLELGLTVEGKAVNGKVQAVLPLTEPFATIRELAAPMAVAWVSITNPNGAFEPGQRVLSPFLPTGPIATVPSRAVREEADSAGGSNVQVIRSEYVADVPVRVLGSPGPERSQVSGPFRPTDVLIVSSSVPLLAGTLIRFGGAGGASGNVEAQAPRPGEVGEMAGITPPARSGGVAPIGAPGSAIPRAGSARPAPSRPAAPRQPAATQPPRTGGTAMPF
ncbi:MAG TPA: HlyD family efflux transporter periplasmic adaptor subunit [Isosphaeraceae bacterium]|jgi:RND family efflux transporter MFP subunit|nr:HlyD family efflux transporter periplasmic adaptor subunit [Isosphaeraceae bacterium]